MIGSAQLQQRLATLLGLAILVTVVGARSASAQTGGPYAFTKIQYPGSTYTDATGITNAGLVVGTYRDAGGNRHGFTFDGVTYRPIEFPGSVSNYAIGIGPQGQALGTWANHVDGPYHAFIEENGVYTSFDYPGMDTDARGMNNQGQIAGVFNAGGLTTPHGFVKTGETYQVIDVPGAWGTEPWGINDAGLVSGNYYDTAAGGIHGFVYFDGAYQSVNYPGASLTRLTRLNNFNQGVGWQRQSAGTFGFLVHGPSYRSIIYTGSVTTIVAGINDSGQVVGRYNGPDCPDGCGFIGTPTTGLPRCDQSIAMHYANNVLTLNFDVTTTVPTTWATYLFLQNTLVPLWLAAIPPLDTSFNLPLAGVPKLGYVSGISLMSTPAQGIVCADYALINTGF